ncbi:trigger factor [Thermonema lapsum]|uniref:Trigger factor n=1 Tax=Thermonema lapsum TaxID=28195 RepID=A0A846MPM8_9BACT|nr:trigger factor [Thermonema lapsum]NIK73536.1 trigger factor [Thermonema lapsum]
MEIKFEKQNPTLGHLRVVLEKDDYMPTVEQKIKEYSKTAVVKGFRKGKVPTSLIKKLYGKSILAEEVFRKAVQSMYDYIREQQLPMVGEPLPKENTDFHFDLDKPGTFTFDYEVGLHTEINYKDVVNKDTQLDAYKVEATDKDIEEVIQNLRKQFAKTEHPETSQEGDFLYGKIESIVEEGSEIEPIVMDNTALPLNQVKEEARAQFIGLKKGDVVTFKLDVLADHKMAGYLLGIFEEGRVEQYKDVEFRFTITDIVRQVPAELNEELFKKALPNRNDIKDEATFRAAIKEEIEKIYEKNTNSLLSDSIAEVLLEKIKIDLPHDFLKRWLKANNEKLSEEQIEREYPRFEEFLRWSLIKQAIAKDENIEISEEEIFEEAKASLQRMFEQQGLPLHMMNIDLDAITRRYLMDSEGKNYREVRDEVMQRKLIERIKNNLSLNLKTINTDEYKKLVDEINAKQEEKAKQLAEKAAQSAE